MRVYLAARFSRRAEIAGYAKELAELDIACTSEWLKYDRTDRMLADCAKRDIANINEAELLVEFTAQPEGKWRGGHIWEAGYAYGRDIPCIAIGPKENVFHELNDIPTFDTWEEGKRYLVWLSKQPLKD